MKLFLTITALLSPFSASAVRDCNSTQGSFAVFAKKVGKNLRVASNVAAYSLGNGRVAIVNPSIKNISDEQRSFLRSLGIVIQGNKVLILRKPELVAKALQKRIQQIAAEGTVAEDDTLLPVHVYEGTFSGDIKKVKVGEKVPRGYEDTLLKYEGFLRMVANGEWPLGSASTISNGGLQLLVHDLAHFGSFVEFPDYMALMRKRAQEIVESGDFIDSSFNIRMYFYLAESLAIIKKGGRDALTKITEENGINLSVKNMEELANKLSSKSESEFNQLSKQLKKFHKQQVKNIGGGARDSVAVADAKKGSKYIYVRMNIEGQYQKIFDSKLNHEGRARAIASYLYAVKLQSDISIKEWFEESAKGQLKRDGKVYNLLCKSGVYPVSEIRSICR